MVEDATSPNKITDANQKFSQIDCFELGPNGAVRLKPNMTLDKSPFELGPDGAVRLKPNTTIEGTPFSAAFELGPDGDVYLKPNMTIDGRLFYGACKFIQDGVVRKDSFYEPALYKDIYWSLPSSATPEPDATVATPVKSIIEPPTVEESAAPSPLDEVDARSGASGKPKESSSQKPSSRDLVKVSMNFNRETIKVLRSLSQTYGTTMTEVVRRGLVIQKFIAEETGSGSKLLIEDAKGRIRRVLLP